MIVGNQIHRSKRTQSGFTIAELLIVIIVIAILAAIIIVAYNGIRTRAIDSKIQSDLQTAASKLAQFSATDDSNLYPTDFSETGMQSSAQAGQTTYIYNTDPGRTLYCLQGINTGRSFFVTNGSSTPQPGVCDGTTGTPTDGNIAENTDLSGSETQVVTNVSGTSQFYTVDIPAGVDYVSFHTSGGTEVGTWGVNLRVKHGSAPTSGSNDCSSTNASQNFENCYITSPSAGTWHVELFLYSGGETYSNVNLVFEWGYFEGAYDGPETISAGYWSRRYYTVNVPAGTDFLSANVSGGTDTGWGANVAVKYNARPGTATSPTSGADCTSTSSNDNNDSCFISNPTPGTWHILVMSNISASGDGTYTNALFDVEVGDYEGAYSAPVTISAGPWARKIYSYNIPAGTDYVSFTTSGGTETGYGANVAVKAGGVPGSNSSPYGNSDCYSMGNDNYESCFMYNPTPGTWYADVYSGSIYAATFNNVDFSIQSGDWPGAYTAPVVLNGGYLTRTMYTLNVPAGQTSLTVTLSGGTETSYGANLGIRYNALPGSSTSITSNTDCYSYGSTNAESCVINSPAAGTWYIMVASGSGSLGNTSTFNNVTLTATITP